MFDLLTDGSSSSVQFIFAHGAGAPMDSPFMNTMAAALAAHGVEVVRFEFPYMAARRDGARKPPDREATLRAAWHEVIEARRDARRIFIGGKSMGGRIATMIADASRVTGVVCFGYPFHPSGKPDAVRTAHLATLVTPTLIVQGTRDALGSREEVASYRLSPSIRIHWSEDGDHSLKPRVKSGRTEAQSLGEAAAVAAGFMK